MFGGNCGFEKLEYLEGIYIVAHFGLEAKGTIGQGQRRYRALF